MAAGGRAARCASQLPCACRRGGSLGEAGNAFTVLLALAAAATAAWALAESLQVTDGRVSEFWAIVTDARSRVRASCMQALTWPWRLEAVLHRGSEQSMTS